MNLKAVLWCRIMHICQCARYIFSILAREDKLYRLAGCRENHFLITIRITYLYTSPAKAVLLLVTSQTFYINCFDCKMEIYVKVYMFNFCSVPCEV